VLSSAVAMCPPSRWIQRLMMKRAGAIRTRARQKCQVADVAMCIGVVVIWVRSSSCRCRAQGQLSIGSVEVPGQGGVMAGCRSPAPVCATARVACRRRRSEGFRRPQVGHVRPVRDRQPDGGEPMGAALGDRVDRYGLGGASGDEPSAAVPGRSTLLDQITLHVVFARHIALHVPRGLGRAGRRVRGQVSRTPKSIARLSVVSRRRRRRIVTDAGIEGLLRAVQVSPLSSEYEIRAYGTTAAMLTLQPARVRAWSAGIHATRSVRMREARLDDLAPAGRCTR